MKTTLSFCRRLSFLATIATLAALPALAQPNPVRLNEILVHAERATNLHGSTVGWVELFNPSGSMIDLSGFRLSDTASQPDKYRIPAATIMPPMSFLLINLWATNLVGLNTGFTLKADNGGSLFFYDGAGTLLDSITFGMQAADYSLGRVPNGSGAWCLNELTPGAWNLATALAPPEILKINEWMAINSCTLADPLDGGFDDWIEIYNPSNRPVALENLYLSDDLQNLQKTRIPPLSFIGTREGEAYAVFIADGKPSLGANHVNFKLNAAGESIALTQPDGVSIIDAVTTSMPPQDIAEGRLPDGSTNIIQFLPQTKGLTASPGRANPLPSILDIGLSANLTEFRLRFTVQANLDCTVQYRDGGAGAWIALTNIPAAATNREVEVIDPGGASGSRFYRAKR
jgi:hypothetical protein